MAGVVLSTPSVNGDTIAPTVDLDLCLGRARRRYRRRFRRRCRLRCRRVHLRRRQVHRRCRRRSRHRRHPRLRRRFQTCLHTSQSTTSVGTGQIRPAPCAAQVVLLLTLLCVKRHQAWTFLSAPPYWNMSPTTATTHRASTVAGPISPASCRHKFNLIFVFSASSFVA